MKMWERKLAAALAVLVTIASMPAGSLALAQEETESGMTAIQEETGAAVLETAQETADVTVMEPAQEESAAASEETPSEGMEAAAAETEPETDAQGIPAADAQTTAEDAAGTETVSDLSETEDATAKTETEIAVLDDASELEMIIEDSESADIAPVDSDTETLSGNCGADGADVTWTLKDGVLTVSVKKVSGASGYQVVAATDKALKKNKKTVTVTGTTATLNGLKKGKTYYVRVRAYKTDSAGKKVYGNYSKVKKVKIRK